MHCGCYLLTIYFELVWLVIIWVGMWFLFACGVGLCLWLCLLMLWYVWFCLKFVFICFHGDAVYYVWLFAFALNNGMCNCVDNCIDLGCCLGFWLLWIIAWLLCTLISVGLWVAVMLLSLYWLICAVACVCYLFYWFGCC